MDRMKPVDRRSMSTHPAIPAKIPVPSGASPRGDGLLIGSGRVVVDAYVDFLCPFCRLFEDRSRPTLERLLHEGAITIVYHPLGFLDRLSTSHYSSRASAASAAAAQIGMFAPYKDALFANQPEEGGPGLDDNELAGLGRSVGIGDELEFARFADAVFSGTYLPWTSYISEIALDSGVGGTPAVLVAGTAVQAHPETIEAAVRERSP
jgi:protein-disulfide isomerase